MSESNKVERVASITPAQSKEIAGIACSIIGALPKLVLLVLAVYKATKENYKDDDLSKRSIVSLVKGGIMAAADLQSDDDEADFARLLGKALRKAKLVDKVEREEHEPNTTGCIMAVAAYDALTGRGRKPSLKDLNECRWSLGQLIANETKGEGLTIGKLRKLASTVTMPANTVAMPVPV